MIYHYATFGYYFNRTTTGGNYTKYSFVMVTSASLRVYYPLRETAHTAINTRQ